MTAMTMKTFKEKVAIIGSGNWGSVISKIVGNNIQKIQQYDQTVNVWVFEEEFKGQKLTQIINTKHENEKYLPNIKLPGNVVAIPNVVEAAKDATLLIFVLPHQFLNGVCDQLRGQIDTKKCRAISLIKGVEITQTGISLISDIIRTKLDIDCSVLSGKFLCLFVMIGANIASEIANEQFSESTLGYHIKENAVIFKQLLDTRYFRVSWVQDVAGVELCGALKNIVALAAGFVDGLKMGDNTKAAVIRIGLIEMKKFSQMYFENVKGLIFSILINPDETYFESCGVADVITSCMGGRNRKIAEAHVTTGKSFTQLENELLNGQKLQGTLTANEVHHLLKLKGKTNDFPLFTSVYEIVYENASVKNLFHRL